MSKSANNKRYFDKSVENLSKDYDLNGLMKKDFEFFIS